MYKFKNADNYTNYNVTQIIGHPVYFIVSNFIAGSGPGVLAAYLWDDKIAINKKWDKVLANSNNEPYKEYIDDAFLGTIIHEMTHRRFTRIRYRLLKEYNISIFQYYYLPNYKFIKWVDEVNADFGVYHYIKDYKKASEILQNSIIEDLYQLDLMVCFLYHPNTTAKLRKYFDILLWELSQDCDYEQLRLSYKIGMKKWMCSTGAFIDNMGDSDVYVDYKKYYKSILEKLDEYYMDKQFEH